MSRWVRVQTSIFEHELFTAEPLSQREAWLWLIANVAWKETRHRIGNDVLTVPVGSMFITLRGLQAAWHWGSDKRVRTFLSVLERENMIETKTDAGKTQISVCNYSRYQDGGRTEDAAGTQPGRTEDALKTPVHQDTNTSLRSVNKRGTRLPDDFEADFDVAAKQGFNRSQAEFEFEKFKDYWNAKSGKDATKLDWPATWRNWIRNAQRPRGDRPTQQAPPKPQPEFLQRHERIRQNLQRELYGDENAEPTGNVIDLAERDYRTH